MLKCKKKSLCSIIIKLTSYYSETDIVYNLKIPPIIFLINFKYSKKANLYYNFLLSFTQNGFLEYNDLLLHLTLK